MSLHDVPPFSRMGIGRWLKIIDAGVLELADEADSKSVGLITRAGSTPATGTTPQRLANPWYDWVCGLFFMLCVLMYCHSYIIRFAIYGLILGGTLEGHKASWGGIYAQNRIGRCNLRVEIQVRVNVWGGRNITVPQPFLNFFQADTVCIQQTCAAMTKFVKANVRQVMLFENLSESVTDIIGSNRVAIRPTKNIVAFNVAFAKQTLVFPLLMFLLKKEISLFLNLRKAAVTAFRFGLILFHCFIDFDNGVLDGQHIVFKVDTIPL